MLWIATLLLFTCTDDRAEAIELLRAGRQRAAADILSRLLDEQPVNPELRSELVRVEMRIGRYASALQHAESLGPAFDATRGKALYLLGRYDEALVFLKSDDSESILFRHESLRVLARFEEAGEALKQAAKLLGEDHIEVRVRRGQAFAREGKLEEAVAQFRPALERDPLSAAAMFGLGRALLDLDKPDEAIAVLERHRALTPLLDGLDFARRNLQLDLSHAPNHAALGDAFRVLVPLDPRLVQEARNSYASAAKLAETDEVAPIALRHARLFEENLGDPAQAVHVLDEAFAQLADARLAVRAGDVWMRAGKPRAAQLQFERAQALRPNDKAIAERIRLAHAAQNKESTPR